MDLLASRRRAPGRRAPARVSAMVTGAVAATLMGVMGVVPVAWAQAADPILPQQWALAKIHAADAWGTSTGKGVVVAVVDTGVDFDHEDLRGQSAGSYTCVGGCVDGGGDVRGHGTAVASIIAAVSNNGVGIASVAPGAKIMSVRVLDENGGGTVDDVTAGIRFAADHGAKVINISIGTPLDLPLVFGLLTPDLQGAVDYAWAKGSLVVAAAGNGGLASSYTGMRNLVVVGATGPNDEVSRYSSSLTGVTIYAPGGNDSAGRCTAVECITVAAAPNVYRAMEGTSFAAPHVSGVAADLAALGLSNAAIVDRLKSTADRIPAGLRVDAARAVGPPSPPSPTPPAPSPTVLAQAPVAPRPPVTRAPRPASSTASPSPSPSPTLPDESPAPEVVPPPSPATSLSPAARAAGPPSSGDGSGGAKVFVLALLLVAAGGGAVLALVRQKG